MPSMHHHVVQKQKQKQEQTQKCCFQPLVLEFRQQNIVIDLSAHSGTLCNLQIQT